MFVDRSAVHSAAQSTYDIRILHCKLVFLDLLVAFFWKVMQCSKMNARLRKHAQTEAIVCLLVTSNKASSHLDVLWSVDSCILIRLSFSSGYHSVRIFELRNYAQKLIRFSYTFLIHVFFILNSFLSLAFFLQISHHRSSAIMPPANQSLAYLGFLIYSPGSTLRSPLETCTMR